MVENERKPAIRFAGFTDAWEQRKVGNILRSASIDIEPNPEELGDYEVIQQGSVPLAGFTNKEPYKDYKNIVLFGDHTLSIYKPKKPFLVASDGVKAYFLDNVNGSYLSYLLENNLPKNEGYKRYSSILKDKDIFLTYCREEQLKIATFLDSLNGLITLHQRKCDKLVDIKKSLLEKMFPADGDDIPKVRFKGYTDAWEQRKVGNILRSASIDIEPNPEELGDYEVIQQGSVPLAGFTNKEPYKDYKNIVLFGDHTLSIYKPKKPFLVASDGVKAYFLDNVNGSYLSYLLENNLPKNEGYKRYSSILKDKDIFLTYCREEQLKIATFLDSLNGLITLHQRKCEKLKNIKKSLLEKMFI